jgi:hypothetical protein
MNFFVTGGRSLRLAFLGIQIEKAWQLGVRELDLCSKGNLASNIVMSKQYKSLKKKNRWFIFSLAFFYQILLE